MKLIVIDHRGQKRRIADVSDLLRGRPKGRFTARVRNTPDLILVGSWVALMALLLIPVPAGNPWSILPGLMLWLMLAPFIYLTTALRRGRRAVRRCLEMDMCPTCGYQLTGLEAAADGCVVCPECTAAWRLPPEQRSEGAV